MAEALEFAPVTADRWPDLARLFERRGGPKYCWCMVWRELPSGQPTVIEGYPVDPDSPSYRFMGVRSVFLAAGFEEIGRVGKRRHAMRRWLRPGGARGHSAAG